MRGMWVRVRTTISLPYVIPDSEYPVKLVLPVRINLASIKATIRINKYNEGDVGQGEDYHQSAVRNFGFRISG